MNRFDSSQSEPAPRALILRAAGTNCDRETAFAFEMAGAVAERVHINRLLEAPERLRDYQILALPGGFSYGDDVSAGRILANQLRTGLRAELDRFLDEKKLILGICNGFQVLVKAGLLPGNERWRPEVSLITNDSNKYEDRWVWLKICSGSTEFIKEEEGTLYLPVAHAEGKFVAADGDLLRRLDAGGQIVLRYCTEAGGEPAYPQNPNGSADHVAGLCDPEGRVFGLMPHPERFVRPQHHPQWTRRAAPWGEAQGIRLFQNAVNALRTSREETA